MDALQDPQYRTADGSALRIWRDTAKNGFMSERLGRPMFDECIFVEVISPGSRDSTPVFELVRKYCPEMQIAEPSYGPKYEELKSYVIEFEKGEDADASLSGTPFSQWAEMPRTLAATLKAQNIFSVDALANLPDTKLNAVGPDGRLWREKAKAYLANAADGAVATQLAALVEQLKIDGAEKDAQIKALADQIAAMQAAPAAVAAPAPAKAGKTATATVAEPAPAADPVAEPLAIADAAAII